MVATRCKSVNLNASRDDHLAEFLSSECLMLFIVDGKRGQVRGDQKHVAFTAKDVKMDKRLFNKLMLNRAM